MCVFSSPSKVNIERAEICFYEIFVSNECKRITNPCQALVHVLLKFLPGYDSSTNLNKTICSNSNQLRLEEKYNTEAKSNPELNCTSFCSFAICTSPKSKVCFAPKSHQAET